MNAYDRAPKGYRYEHTLIRIETDQGIEGIGAGTYDRPDEAYVESLKILIGANPLEIYQMDGERIIGRAPAFDNVLKENRHLDGPLYDLIGKLLNRPAWSLIGKSKRERIPVYDSTIYFSDVWFKDRGISAVVQEAQESVKSGFHAIKVKVGRGYRWMEEAAGDQRDIEVIHAVRDGVGPNVLVMADANYGYRGRFDAAWRLIYETRGDRLYWMEEIFPESVNGYQILREKMNKAGIKTLIAAGEHVRDVNAFKPYLTPIRLMDVLQMDIRQGGFLDNIEIAHMTAAVGGVAIPHNWASQIGLIMAIHLSRAVDAVPMVESDRSTCDVLIVEYELLNGNLVIPNKPGLGIEIDKRVYARQCKPNEIVIA